MKLIFLDVNGIRASAKREHLPYFFSQNQIFWLSRNKSYPDQLPENKFGPEIYSYFDSSTSLKGYSRVAVYTKIAPKKLSMDLG